MDIFILIGEHEAKPSGVMVFAFDNPTARNDEIRKWVAKYGEAVRFERYDVPLEGSNRGRTMLVRLGDVIYWIVSALVAFELIGAAVFIPIYGFLYGFGASETGRWENLAGGAAGLAGLWFFALALRYVLSGRGIRP
jgi:hypothetical protein